MSTSAATKKEEKPSTTTAESTGGGTKATSPVPACQQDGSCCIPCESPAAINTCTLPRGKHGFAKFVSPVFAMSQTQDKFLELYSHPIHEDTRAIELLQVFNPYDVMLGLFIFKSQIVRDPVTKQSRFEAPSESDFYDGEHEVTNAPGLTDTALLAAHKQTCPPLIRVRPLAVAMANCVTEINTTVCLPVLMKDAKEIFFNMLSDRIRQQILADRCSKKLPGEFNWNAVGLDERCAALGKMFIKAEYYEEPATIEAASPSSDPMPARGGHHTHARQPTRYELFTGTNPDFNQTLVAMIPPKDGETLTWIKPDDTKVVLSAIKPETYAKIAGFFCIMFPEEVKNRKPDDTDESWCRRVVGPSKAYPKGAMYHDGTEVHIAQSAIAAIIRFYKERFANGPVKHHMAWLPCTQEGSVYTHGGLEWLEKVLDVHGILQQPIHKGSPVTNKQQQLERADFKRIPEITFQFKSHTCLPEARFELSS